MDNHKTQDEPKDASGNMYSPQELNRRIVMLELSIENIKTMLWMMDKQITEHIGDKGDYRG